MTQSLGAARLCIELILIVKGWVFYLVAGRLHHK